MFIPNNICQYYAKRNAKVDNFARYTWARPTATRCTLVTWQSVVTPSSIRADSSASHGSADQLQGNPKFAFTKAAILEIGDKFEFGGSFLEITQVSPLYDVFGRLDHFEVLARIAASL